MLVNLRMEGVHLKELFSINWLCESGLVENIELVVEEYRQTRRLLVCMKAENRNMSVQRIHKSVEGNMNCLNHETGGYIKIYQHSVATFPCV